MEKKNKGRSFVLFLTALLTGFIEMACVFYKALLERLVYNIYKYIYFLERLVYNIYIYL
jgi:hypothetical protein